MASEKSPTTRIRNLLIVLSILFFTASGFYFGRQEHFIAILLSIAGIVSIFILNRTYKKMDEAIIFFFDSLKNHDTTTRFREKTGNKKLDWMNQRMNELNEFFQEIKLRNEYNESYYRTLLYNATAGLIVLGSENKIELINKTACNYAGISSESTNHDLLRIKHPEFYEAIRKMVPGDNIIYKNLVGGNLQLLSFRATMIRRKDEKLKLISIQDIRTELESKEIESYRKLMSVMTHEIMNLISPLTAVSSELHDKWNKEAERSDPDETLAKTTVTGLKLINEQSTSLVNFMNNYRKLSRLPSPEFSSFSAEEWIDQLKIVFSAMMKENDVDFKISSEKQLTEVTGDRKLLNQVMVNLINNSLDAVMENEGERKISIRMIRNSNDKLSIKITNNGPVIAPGLLDKIFVPFFTTKKKGSGVGLSICQEIMKLHNGSLVAISSDVQTCFIAEF